MHFVKDMKELKTTAPIWQLIAGGLMEVPPTTSPVYVDVRDVALAHVRAVEIPVARNQRYMLNAGHFSFDQVAHLIRQKRLELASNVPSSEGLPPSPHFKTDSSKAERDLGIKFITFEKMILDTVDKLVQLNKSLAH
jgi:nucleoside-diphosphate-sugar epimerase